MSSTLSEGLSFAVILLGGEPNHPKTAKMQDSVKELNLGTSRVDT